MNGLAAACQCRWERSGDAPNYVYTLTVHPEAATFALNDKESARRKFITEAIKQIRTAVHLVPDERGPITLGERNPDPDALERQSLLAKSGVTLPVAKRFTGTHLEPAAWRQVLDRLNDQEIAQLSQGKWLEFLTLGLSEPAMRDLWKAVGGSDLLGTYTSFESDGTVREAFDISHAVFRSRLFLARVDSKSASTVAVVADVGKALTELEVPYALFPQPVFIVDDLLFRDAPEQDFPDFAESFLPLEPSAEDEQFAKIRGLVSFPRAGSRDLPDAIVQATGLWTFCDWVDQSESTTGEQPILVSDSSTAPKVTGSDKLAQGGSSPGKSTPKDPVCPISTPEFTDLPLWKVVRLMRLWGTPYKPYLIGQTIFLQRTETSINDESSAPRKLTVPPTTALIDARRFTTSN